MTIIAVFAVILILMAGRFFVTLTYPKKIDWENQYYDREVI